MRKAKYIISRCIVACAYCDQLIPSPSGNGIWDELELKGHGPYVHCNECGSQSQAVAASSYQKKMAIAK